MMEVLKKARVLLMILGLLFLFIGERYLVEYEFQVPFIVLSFAFMIQGLLASVLAASAAKKQGFERESQIWGQTMIWKLVILTSAILYFVYVFSLGDAKSPETVLHKVSLATWLLSLILGSFYAIGVELGVSSSGFGELADPQRVKRQGATWLRIGMLVGTLVCLNYVAVKKNQAHDLSYLKTTLPGESTEALVSTSSKPVSIGAFFTRDSDVGPLVREYLLKNKEF